MDYKYEAEILAYLKKHESASIEGISEGISIKPDASMRPIASLEQKGMIRTETAVSESFEFTPEGRKCESELLPEIRIYLKAQSGKGFSDLAEDELKFGLKWAKNKGLVDIIQGRLVPKAKLTPEDARKSSKNYLLQKENLPELLERGIMARKSSRKVVAFITEKGKSSEAGSEGLTQLTSEMLRSGAWKGAKFKEYDVSVPGKNAERGRAHPITLATDRIRRVFAEMGFEEMQGNYVQGAFWNFDALFQPQDHPARELADTFYLEGEEELPDAKLVERVKKAHEGGWGYSWEKSEARRRVLRTHTTALSARYLASMKNPPKKYFSVGRVFRNEATDFKHLAEFFQVEGIISWEGATFRDLLGMLKEFYSKLGFKDIRFRPSYFPYTEPSLEIECYFPERKKWIEMGGAGIMRAEVSKPLANTYPVLAWGLSLERPLMLLMGISDIRTFYKNDLSWLKTAKVKL